MRITTKTIFENGINQLGTLQSALARTQQQLSTNHRVVVPSDDPVAAARALELGQSQSINTQLGTNRQNARSALSQEEVSLASVGSLMQDIRDASVNAGNGSMTNSDREKLAVQLESNLNEMLGLANTADGSGNYIFSGFKLNTPPFAASAAGATYVGDQGMRELQVGAVRKMAISDSGSSVFENNRTGNGTFVTSPGAANVTNGGSGIISPGSVTDSSKLTGDNYQLVFSVTGTPAVTTYTVMDQTSGQPVPPLPAIPVPIPYTSGQAISFDGLQFDIKGAPANGDTFAVTPSQNQSVFTTVKNLITALRSQGEGAAGNADLNNKLNQANANLDNAYSNVLSVRASVGARLNELDSLDGSGEGMDIQYTQSISDLIDVDMAKAISLFTQQTTNLQAAQMSYQKLTQLSLFNYIT
jgi:flagellar hook-associated protein 3 FlgL